MTQEPVLVHGQPRRLGTAVLRDSVSSVTSGLQRDLCLGKQPSSNEKTLKWILPGTTTLRSHDLWLHISKIHKGSATKSVWAPQKCQTLDVKTQRWDCKEALKIGMKVTRGLMRAGGKAFPFRELPIRLPVQGADKCEEAVSQSVRQSMSRRSRSVAITWMKFLCWQVTHSLPESCTHSEAGNVWGMRNSFPLSLSL